MRKNIPDFHADYCSRDLYLVVTRGMGFINVPVLEEKFNYIEPFFDNRLINFIYSLPDEWRINNKLYAAMLTKFFPKYFSEIPWQKTGAPINGASFVVIKRNVSDNKKRVVLFGASELGKKSLELLKHEYGQIYFCDNDIKKWHCFINGTEVISPLELRELSRKNEVKVFITSMYWPEISLQLLDMGITNFEVLEQVRDYRNYDKWFRSPGVYENF